MRDLERGEDPDVLATIAVISAVDADILVLQDFDYDGGEAALSSLAERLEAAGAPYPYHFSRRPNTGWPTDVDVDGDGRSYGPRDAHGYGRFNGEGGMAILSRHPIGAVRDFSGFLWQNLPGGQADLVLSADAYAVLRLHTVAAWDVAVLVDGTPFHILTSHASPPVFDGPEDRNGRRNADELRFWQLYLDGWSPDGAERATSPFALAGTFNVDPELGEGRPEGISGLLQHRAVQDPHPARPSGGFETADWEEPTPGDLRVDFILPAAGLEVVQSAILWPEDATILGIDAETAAEASDHRLIWVDLRF